MIYCLTGKLLEKAPDYAVVSCGGVGYLAAIPSTTAGALPAVGDTCTLYTCMNVTENDVSLFGFADKESQTMFRLLTGVSGVGPKVGLSILSTMSAREAAIAIVSGDDKALAKVPGIGKKTAQRLVLELKGSIENQALISHLPAQTMAGEEKPVADAIAILTAMGFQAQDAAAAVALIKADGGTAEEMAVSALRKLDRMK